MKKLLLCAGIAVATASTFTACDSNSCYTCNLTAIGITNTIDICDGQATTSVNGFTTSTTSIPNGMTELEYKQDLEGSGYTCNTK